jgi:hypothetical protein
MGGTVLTQAQTGSIPLARKIDPVVSCLMRALGFEA